MSKKPSRDRSEEMRDAVMSLASSYGAWTSESRKALTKAIRHQTRCPCAGPLMQMMSGLASLGLLIIDQVHAGHLKINLDEKTEQLLPEEVDTSD